MVTLISVPARTLVPRYGVLLAIAAENDWRLSRLHRHLPARPPGPPATCGCARTGGAGASSSAGSRGAAPGPPAPLRRTCATTAAETAAGAANTQASDIALAHRSVPGGLDLTGLRVDCDAVVDAVVDENVGIGTTAERAVLVVDHRGLPGRTAVQLSLPHLRSIGGKYTGLALTNFTRSMALLVLTPKLVIHQVGDRSRLASGVVLVVPEGDVHHVMTVVVVLVAADREIRHCRASAGCGRKPFPRQSWGCRCSRFRPRTASQRPLT